jgi:hypothetical protein
MAGWFEECHQVQAKPASKPYPSYFGHFLLVQAHTRFGRLLAGRGLKQSLPPSLAPDGVERLPETFHQRRLRRGVLALERLLLPAHTTVKGNILGVWRASPATNRV